MKRFKCMERAPQCGGHPGGVLLQKGRMVGCDMSWGQLVLSRNVVNFMRFSPFDHCFYHHFLAPWSLEDFPENSLSGWKMREISVVDEGKRLLIGQRTNTQKGWNFNEFHPKVTPKWGVARRSWEFSITSVSFISCMMMSLWTTRWMH